MLMDNIQVIEPVINFHKVKYDHLTQLIRDSKMEGSKINIFINLDCILDLFYTEKMIPLVSSLRHHENIILTAEIINLIAHYRHFFWSRFRASSKFYFYSCTEVPRWQSSKNSDYMCFFNIKKDEDHLLYGAVNQVFNSNLRLVNLISTYVKGAYYIESNGLEPSVIPYYLIKNVAKKDECNLILTADKMEYDLTNLDNTFILRARGNKSKIIGRADILDHKFKNVKYRPKNNFSPDLYPLIYAIDGYNKRNIGKVKGITFVKGMKMLDELIDKKVIRNGRNGTLHYDMFEDYLNEDQFCTLEKNYKCTNLDYAYKMIKHIDEIRIQDCLIDKYDNISIMNLNAQYFQGNNIQLVELCEGIEEMK